MHNRTGFTLLELSLVLVILGTLSIAAVPPLLRARDSLAVSAARAELAGAITAARGTAIVAGGATLHVDIAAGYAWIEAAGGGRVPAEYPLTKRYGVILATERGTPLALRFDALGIGRLANATVRVRRGRAEAVLTVSSYGRVRL